MLRPQIRTLSKSFRVVAIDPRAQGKFGRTADSLYPNRGAQDFREVIDKLKLAAARIEMFENAGHALFVDEAERFIKLVAEFAAPRN